MAKIIEVTVSPTGDVTVQTKGFTGGECREATRNLEAALGVKISDQPTSEFYAQSENKQTAQQ